MYLLIFGSFLENMLVYLASDGLPSEGALSPPGDSDGGAGAAIAACRGAWLRPICTVEDLAWVERRCAVCYVLSTLLGTGWFLVPTLSYMQQDAASAEAARLQRAEETAGRDRGKVKTA